MPLATGTRLGSYKITGPLGAGGMGEVYRARDATLNRDVAIKVLPEYGSRDPERLRRFEQEAQATAALNHPNIVSIFHVGQLDGSPYIVIELLQGETLRDRLHKGPMRLREVLDYGVELARGLAAAHDAGIVHRDLKPENVWITKDGRIKILDFGLAKLDPAKTASADGATVSLGQQSSPGQVLGTVGYMSPEQVRGQIADPRSDIFAAGAVLYEMLTGTPAFRKATSADTMSAILNEDPPAVSQIVPSVPPGLQRVVSRCLAKNPAQRLQHASDLEFALEALSDSSGSTVTGVHAPASSKTRSWLAAGAVIVIAIGAALALWWRQQPAVPMVEAVTQLTNDGRVKGIGGRLVTDGSRVYFLEGSVGSYQTAQIAAIGGPTAIISTRLANFQFTALSQDGSYLLGAGCDQFICPLWTVPLPTGEPRRMGSIESQDGDFFPDGRILFAQRNELYIADKDGSNPRRILSADDDIDWPSVSPDGQRLVFTLHKAKVRTINEVLVDDSGLRTLVNSSDTGRVCCPAWTPDGRYIVYVSRYENRRDLWLLPMKTGFFSRRQQPIQLTNGPLSYTRPVVARDGKHIFAVGTEHRGELVRYDNKSKQFVPTLPGVAAFNPTFSRDGKWVTYTVFPDHALWRSRTDGTDPLQLTFPPAQVFFPSISPDGTQVVYTTSGGATRLISMEGGTPQTLVEADSRSARWSPDGSRLVLIDTSNPAHSNIQIFNLRTGKRSVVPGGEGFHDVRWVADDLLAAITEDSKKIMIFDERTQKWSDLVSATLPGYMVNIEGSPDLKYVYYTTGGPEPMTFRVRLADHVVETITSLKTLPLAVGPGENTQFGVAADGSPVFSRDIGTQEIYALSIKWP